MNIPITEILEHARRAPSVHNVQPWHFTTADSSVSVFIEHSRILDAGDPTRRELWISLGICIEAILKSAEGLGFNGIIETVQTESAADQIALIRFKPAKQKYPEIIETLQNRHSYRGPMAPLSVPASFVKQCQEAIADLHDVSIVFVNDRQTMEQVAEVADKGIRLALSSADFRKELAELLHYNWSPSRTGLHGYALNHGTLGSIWEKWSVILGIDSKRKARADRQKVLESSGLFFILSKGDVPRFWLDVGRAYMRIALAITHAGFAHSTLTAPVEAARFHEDIEKTLQTTDRIQSMIRIGKATRPMGQTSPRLSVDELLT